MVYFFLWFEHEAEHNGEPWILTWSIYYILVVLADFLVFQPLFCILEIWVLIKFFNKRITQKPILRKLIFLANPYAETFIHQTWINWHTDKQSADKKRDTILKKLMVIEQYHLFLFCCCCCENLRNLQEISTWRNIVPLNNFVM